MTAADTAIDRKSMRFASEQARRGTVVGYPAKLRRPPNVDGFSFTADCVEGS